MASQSAAKKFVLVIWDCSPQIYPVCKMVWAKCPELKVEADGADEGQARRNFYSALLTNARIAQRWMSKGKQRSKIGPIGRWANYIIHHQHRLHALFQEEIHNECRHQHSSP